MQPFYSCNHTEGRKEVAHLSLIFLVLLMLYFYIKEKENDCTNRIMTLVLSIKILE